MILAAGVKAQLFGTRDQWLLNTFHVGRRPHCPAAVRLSIKTAPNLFPIRYMTSRNTGEDPGATSTRALEVALPSDRISTGCR
jgi:hypothetical protein